MALERLRLDGQVAIITGAGRGVGRGIATVFAEAGATIICSARTRTEIDETVAMIEAAGGKAIAVTADVMKRDDLVALVDTTIERFGRIDIVVNNAGIASPPGMPFTRNTEAEWDQAFDVNVKSVFLMCKAITPHFIERRAGRIINIASIAGPLASLTMPPYSVAKGGVIILTRIVAKELAPYGVTVNAICPGILWTGFWQDLARDIAENNPAFRGMTARQVFEKRVAEIVPMGCEQTPEDIGWAAVFLASDEARCITGQSLMVDGGTVI